MAGVGLEDCQRAVTERYHHVVPASAGVDRIDTSQALASLAARLSADGAFCRVPRYQSSEWNMKVRFAQFWARCRVGDIRSCVIIVHVGEHTGVREAVEQKLTERSFGCDIFHLARSGGVTFAWLVCLCVVLEGAKACSFGVRRVGRNLH